MSILRAERDYWQSMYQRAKTREAQLKDRIKELEAKLKLREQQLFGRKTEQSQGKSEQHAPDSSPARKRGQQPGTQGDGRRRHAQLSIKEEFHELPAEEQCCSRCGLPYAPFPDTEDSDLVEVQVKAHVRRIRRKRYTPTCSCLELPVIITAPGPAKRIPKGAYGDSGWIQVFAGYILVLSSDLPVMRKFEAAWVHLTLLENIFIERLWRSVKYEEVYLNDYASVRTAHTRLGRYFDYYNTERPHQALAYNTPADVYFKEQVGQETNMIQDSLKNAP